MNDFNETQPDPNAEKPTAFCQNCGKPLNKETARVVGASVYCEPCLDARLGGARTTAPGYQPVNAAGPSGWSSASTGEPNPGLAFLLGLIPGVGAMYNEQYAKGLVHLTIFALLVVLANANGIFGLFIAGWVFYMAIEAHHTAKAKRDGTPLPNPFGLNDIGDRMGFGQGWTSPQDVANAARDAANAAGFRPAAASSTAGFTGAEPPPQPGAATAGWGAPVDAYPPPYTPPASPYAAQDWQSQGQNYAQPGYGYPPYGAPYPPFVPPVSPVPPPPIVPRNRFPVGAVWLIGLGTIFLLGTEGIFRGVRGEALVGFGILALGVTVFVRRMTAFGSGMENDGTSDYQFRLLYALRPSVWLLLIGVLFLLDTFGVLRWSHSWPFFIILAGVMMLLGRAPFRTPYPYPGVPAAPVAEQPAAGTDMVRLNLHPDEPTKPESGSDSHTGGY
jgi:Domain of unknown function (DUF5668)